MNDFQKHTLISLTLLMVGVILLMFGNSEITEATETSDAMLLTMGFKDLIGGVMFMFISILIQAISYFEGQVNKLRKALDETKKTEFSHNIEDDFE